MSQVRKEIDRLDEALVTLIGERFGYINRAWQLKKKSTTEGALVPWRIEQVVTRVSGYGEKLGLPKGLVEELWRTMMGYFVEYEEEKITLDSSSSNDDVAGSPTAASTTTKQQ